MIGFDTYVLPGAFGSGMYWLKNCACGDRRFGGITLFANCVRVVTPPAVAVVSGSKIGARPLKSPCALRRRRHDADVDDALLPPLPFVAGEEERLVSAVVHPGIITGPPSVPPN